MLNTIPPSHIIVGLSGGVDSSIAAHLLKAAGHKVTAIFMKNWEEETDGICPAAADLKDAEAVCEQLGIELLTVNFAEQYWSAVFSHFLSAYQAGHTPNPDILCNKEIKFKAFLQYAKGKGADYIATGHYARLEKNQDGIKLKKACDLNKDQSYFLHAVDNAALLQSLFPLGELDKNQVRALAKSLALVTHDKKDSTGICFIGERKFKNFLNHYLPAQPGEIVTLTGEVLGLHDGLMFYTIGQRQGLMIGGKKNKADLPWYVAQKIMASNQLVVVQGENHPSLFKQQLFVKHMHWINFPPALPATLQAKTRYRQPDQLCQVSKLHEYYQIDFLTPQRAITPGQYLVLYQEDICLGGGMIEVNP